MAEDDQNITQEDAIPPAPEEQIPEQMVETQAQAEPAPELEIQAAPEVEQPTQPVQEPEQPGFQIQMWQKVALLVVVVLAMGYFAFGQNLNFWPFKINVAPVISPTPTATVDPMADWQTYRNAEYGFEFRYPNNYQIESGEKGLSISPSDPAPSINIYIKSDSVQNLSDKIISSVDEFLKKDTDVKDVIFAGNVAKEIKYGIAIGGTMKNILIPRNGKVIEIELLDNDEQNQILSTFKFVEAEGKFCGGIAAFPCPEGYTCQLEGTYPDAGGKCVKN